MDISELWFLATWVGIRRWCLYEGRCDERIVSVTARQYLGKKKEAILFEKRRRREIQQMREE